MIIEYARFSFVGVLNVLCFLGVNYCLDLLDLSEYRSLTVWAPAWMICAVQAHAAHRWITFRTKAAYRESLAWASLVYGLTAILSTTSMFLLVDLSEMNYWMAWAMNTFVFGSANFLGLRYLAFPPSPDMDAA